MVVRVAEEPRAVAIRPWACGLLALWLAAGCPAGSAPPDGADGGPAPAGADAAAVIPTCDVGSCDPSGGSLPSRSKLACQADFLAQAARPLDSSLPGALTVKTMIDQADADRVHYLDTNAYPMHVGFAVDHLGYSPGTAFNGEYYLPQRRFLLGSVTWYQEPGIWAYELAPYDTASAEQIEKAYRLLAGSSFFCNALRFHPTSQEQASRAQALPADVGRVTTEEIFAGISYQPLNLGTTVGQVRCLTVQELAGGYVSPREIAVLDRVPNDISVVAGLVTAQLQTPLSHVNVLSQQRGTPNMALLGARTVFAAHQGAWVRLTVGPFDFRIEPVTAQEADRWWAEHKPAPVVVQEPDFSRVELIDVDDVSLADVAAVGGKAANFGELRDIAGLHVRDGFVVPVSFYRQHLSENGIDGEIAAMLADERFRGDGTWRRQRLAALQARIIAAPVSPSFQALLEARLAAEYPAVRMRFRSSTNCEDLNGFSGAGLYSSHSGQLGDPTRTPLDAVRRVWASLWNFRAFEEREYLGIDHGKVAMAILVAPAYTDEAANGVAITANIFDPAPGGEDGFYVNAQVGEESVVSPDGSVTADQLLYYFFHNNQPATYLAHSSLVPAGSTVLTRRELYLLGQALDKVRTHFSPLYPRPEGYQHLPMDVEWKLERTAAGESRIEVKQARPYPGRGR